MDEQMENYTITPSSAGYMLFPYWKIGILEMCMLTFSLISGLPTHLYVLWLIVTGSGVASEFFNFSLSICGFFFSVYSLLFLLTNWFSCRLLIALTQFLVGVGVTGHPLFQCLMCVERYLAVVHPVTFLKYKPLRYRVICGALAWIITLCSGFYCTFIYFLSTIYVYTLTYATEFLVFLSIQLFCLVAVLRALKHSGPGERQKEENHMKRRAFHLILVTTLSLVIKYVPFIAIGLLSVLTNMSFGILWSVSYLCFMLTDLGHPVRYLYRNGKIVCFLLPK